jgi:hypothetical protein
MLWLFFLLGNCTLAQDSMWKKQVINEILQLKLPSILDTTKVSFVTTYSGYVKSNYYAFRIYDTTVEKPQTKEIYRLILSGFYNGFLQNDTSKYDMTFNEATISGTNGQIAYLRAKDTTENFKHIYIYLTLANQRFYLFQAFSSNVERNSDNVNLFFDSIIFSANKIEETFLK